MSAKRKEVYARLAVQLRMHDRAFQAEGICPGAMSLYCFLLMQARGEQSRGDVLESVALSAWGVSREIRRKQANALISAGLVEHVDRRLHIVKYAEHNDTPEVIAENRERDRKRKARSRSCPDDVTRDSARIPPGIPSSTSSSSSDSDIAERDHVAVSDPGCGEGSGEGVGAAPPWFHELVDRIHGDTGEQFGVAEAWLRYAGHRAKKHLPTNAKDAGYWLGTVMVPEARRDRERRRQDADRAERRPLARASAGDPDGVRYRELRSGDDPPPVSAEDHRRFAAELLERLGGAA